MNIYGAKIRREVLLEWGRATAKSPYDAEDMDAIINLAQKKTFIKQIYINKYFVLNLFEEIDVRNTLIMGVDVSSGVGKDSSAVVLIDSKTKHIVGILKNPRIDTDELAEVIYTLATTIAKNCVICIERNNVGASVITRLRKTDIEPKLYRELKKDEMKQKMKDGFTKEEDITAANYGIWTDGTKREEMHEILARFVKHYKDRICAFDFVEELQTLEYKKSGKIEHQDGKHDDIIMAFLMGIWSYYYGNNIQNFGIIRRPDPTPGLTEEEEIQKRYAEEIRKSKANMLFSSLFNDNAAIVKTMKDFNREQEMLRMQYEDNIIVDNPNGDGVIGDSETMKRVNIFDSSPMGYDTEGDVDFSDFI